LLLGRVVQERIVCQNRLHSKTKDNDVVFVMSLEFAPFAGWRYHIDELVTMEFYAYCSKFSFLSTIERILKIG